MKNFLLLLVLISAGFVNSYAQTWTSGVSTAVVTQNHTGYTEYNPNNPLDYWYYAVTDITAEFSVNLDSLNQQNKRLTSIVMGVSVYNYYNELIHQYYITKDNGGASLTAPDNKITLNFTEYDSDFDHIELECEAAYEDSNDTYLDVIYETAYYQP